MGVRGLTSFIEAHPEFMESYRLHDCKVVIDGNNLIHFLYSFYNIDYVCGGDYNTFASKTESFFLLFKECNISPVVVIDGGHDICDRTFPTQMERWKERIKRVEQASVTGKSTHSFLPINAIEDFANILLMLDIPLIQCEYDSDAQTASVANHFNCPVLSDDGDFFIFDVVNGLIRLSNFDNFLVLISDDQKTKYFKCKIYRLNKFLSFYPSIEKNMPPLLASLAGNDYIKFDDLKEISHHIYPIKGQKIPQILKYLGNRKYEEVVEQLLLLIPIEKRREFRMLLEVSVNSYRVDSFDLSYLFEKKSQSRDSKIILYSKLVTPCGVRYPNDYILSHTSGCMPSYFLNVVNFHRAFQPPQVGDLTSSSSSHCSRFIRQVLYGILFQHDPSDREHHKLVCLRDVDEYDIHDSKEICFKVKPLFVLPSGKLVPKLFEIKLMNKTSKLEILVEVMGIKKSYLKPIPMTLQLLFGSMNYWLFHCSPKPSKEFFIALLLCIIQFSVLRNPSLKRYSSKVSLNDELSKLHSLLDRITPSESRSALTKFEKYSRQPVFDRYFDVSVIQSYNQLQSCLKYLTSLNKLLASPLKSPNISEIFEGTMLYNITNQLKLGLDSKSFIKSLLGKETPCFKIFKTLLNKVLQNVPDYYPWQKNSRKEFDFKNVVSVSNKFECLNVSDH